MTPQILAEANRLNDAIKLIDSVVYRLTNDKLTTVLFKDQDSDIHCFETQILLDRVRSLDVDMIEEFKSSLLRRRQQFIYEFSKLPGVRDFEGVDFNFLDFNANTDEGPLPSDYYQELFRGLTTDIKASEFDVNNYGTGGSSESFLKVFGTAPINDNGVIKYPDQSGNNNDVIARGSNYLQYISANTQSTKIQDFTISDGTTIEFLARNDDGGNPNYFMGNSEGNRPYMAFNAPTVLLLSFGGQIRFDITLDSTTAWRLYKFKFNIASNLIELSIDGIIQPSESNTDWTFLTFNLLGANKVNFGSISMSNFVVKDNANNTIIHYPLTEGFDLPYDTISKNVQARENNGTWQQDGNLYPRNIAEGFRYGKTEIDVILLFGQSNMVSKVGIHSGGADFFTGDYLLDQNQYYSYDVSTYQRGLGVLNPILSDGTWGSVELSAGKILTQNNRKVLFLKAAFAGTNLHTQWQKGGTSYEAAKTQVLSTLSEIQAEGYTVNIRQCWWLQGEADANSLTDSNNYLSKFTQMRSDFIIDGVFTNDMTFYIGKLSGGVYTYETTINTAYNNIVANFGGQVFETLLLPKAPDNIHYTSDGLITLGESMGNAYIAENYPIDAIDNKWLVPILDDGTAASDGNPVTNPADGGFSDADSVVDFPDNPQVSAYLLDKGITRTDQTFDDIFAYNTKGVPLVKNVNQINQLKFEDSFGVNAKSFNQTVTSDGSLVITFDTAPTIDDYNGTATPTINGNTIEVSVGQLYDITVNGELFPLIETKGTDIWGVLETKATLSTDIGVWDNLNEDAINWLYIFGGELYVNDITPTDKIRVIKGTNGFITPTITGYTKTEQHNANAGVWDSGSEYLNQDNVGLNAVFDAYAGLGVLKNPNQWDFIKLKTIDLLNKLIIPTNNIVDIYQSELLALWELDDTTTTLIDANGTSNALLTGTVEYKQPSNLWNRTECMFGNPFVIRWYRNAMTGLFDGDEGYCSIMIRPNNLTELLDNNTFNFFYAATASGDNRVFARHLQGNNNLELYHIGSGITKVTRVAFPMTNRWVEIGVGWSVSQSKIVIDINGVRAKEEQVTLGTFVGTIIQDGILGNGATANRIYTGDAMRCKMLNAIPTREQIAESFNPHGLINCVGDSRTDEKPWAGIACEINNIGEYAFNKYGYIDDGISGNTIADITARLTTTNSHAIAGKNNILVVWMGVNSSALTAQEIYEGIRDYCISQRSYWNKIIVCTEIDAQDAGRLANNWPTKYLDVNALLRANYTSFADALADLGARIELQDATNITYFTDLVHPTYAGYEVIAEVVAAEIAKFNYIPESDYRQTVSPDGTEVYDIAVLSQ